MVDDGLVVFADDVDSEFLSKCKNRIYNGMRDAHDDVIVETEYCEMLFQLETERSDKELYRIIAQSRPVQMISY